MDSNILEFFTFVNEKKVHKKFPENYDRLPARRCKSAAPEDQGV